MKAEMELNRLVQEALDRGVELTKEQKAEEEKGDKDLEKWMALVESDKEVKVRNYTLVEIVESRKGPVVMAAIARMVARLRYLGFPMRRIHSDRAGELRSATLRRWAEQRGILRTYTAGSDWRSNGRVEGEIGILRRGANVLLRATGTDASKWPLAIRHVAERRGRQQLEALGLPTGRLLTFGQKVAVVTKKWAEFQGHWRARKKAGVIRGPDACMSLTSQGHIVEDEEGRLVPVADVVPINDGDEVQVEGEVQDGGEKLVEVEPVEGEGYGRVAITDDSPRMKLRGKKSRRGKEVPSSPREVA